MVRTSCNPVALVAALVVALAAGRPAAAQVIYMTGFEPAAYTPGPLVGQDGWVLSPAAGALSGPAAQVVSAGGPLSSAAVKVTGGLLAPEKSVNPFYYLGLYRRPIGYDAALHGLPTVSVHVRTMLAGPLSTQTGTPGDYSAGDVYSSNLAAISTAGAFGEISLSADGHVYGYGYGGDISYLFGATAALGQFHDLGLDINFADRTTTYRLDGVALGVDSFAADVPSTVLDRVTLLNYGNLAIPVPAGFERDKYVGYFDDLSVVATPNPTPLPATLPVALAAFASAGLLSRVRARRAAAVLPRVGQVVE